MLLEDIMQILLCWCHKYLWINFFSFGDMYNALRHWANSLHEHNIVLRIWNMCILHVENCPRQKKPKHYSLTTIQTRPLKISSVIVSSLNLLENIKSQRIKSNDWTLLLFVANIGSIAICDNSWCPLWNHCLTFFSPNYSWFI